MLNPWHAEDREVVLHRLGADAERGLAPAESTRRLREHGPNELCAARAPSPGRLLARRLLDPLALAQFVAAVICVRLGEWAAAAAAAAAGAANARLGAFRERPDSGGTALARLSAPAARVVRGGRSFLIPATELVPGDLAEVARGDRVPADLRLCRSHRLVVDESPLTGVALPVGKEAGKALPERTSLADRSNMLYAGTLVTGGEGAGLVIATGMRTELGRIARLLGTAEAPAAPLRRRADDLGQLLALLFFAGVAVLAGAHRLRGGTAESLLAAVASLALVAAPLGLPAAIAATLAAGLRQLRRRGIDAPGPATAEALGRVGVILTDKTGTLTRNEMTVRELLLEDELVETTGRGYDPEGRILRGGEPVDPQRWETLGLALRTAALCSSAVLTRDAGGSWRVDGDPTEGALLTLAAKGKVWRDDLVRGQPPLASFPSTVERRRATVVAAGRSGRPTAYMRGDADAVLAHCLHHRTAVGVRPLSPADRAHILQRAEEMSGRALRVQGLAYREDALGGDARTVERSLVWIGLAGMGDPPREGVTEAVAAGIAAGIDPVIVTGDRAEAGLALAREIGALRPGDEAISGEQLDLLTPEALGACIERYRVCARANAGHKLRIVRAWKRRGRCVAMVGEGVSDAPALREADLGVTLGPGGSEIAREEAAVAIADGGLAALVAAVTCGRGVRENLARVTAFLLALAAAATLPLLVAAALPLPPPFTPLRALWISLVAGVLPALALASTAPDAAPTGESLGGRERALDREWVLLALAGGAGVVLAAAAAYLFARAVGGDAALAGTHGFAVLSLAPLALALGCRHRARPFQEGLARGGRALLAAAGLSALLTAAVVQAPLFSGILGTVPRGRMEWLRIAALSLLPLAAVEAGTAWLRSPPEQ